MGDKALEVQKIATGHSTCPMDHGNAGHARERFAEMQFLLALVGSTLDKVAIEIRNLQRTEINEVRRAV